MDEFGKGQFLSLAQLVRSKLLDSLAIYEPALRGPFVRLFSKLPNYRRSYFWDGAHHGDVRNGVPFEDLRQLSFPDASLDLVLTSDVLEHVMDPMKAHQEIARVLKVGGVHIFSMSTRWPLPDKTISRIRVVDDDIEHALPPRFRRAGDGSASLVVTDFGADVIANLRSINLATQIVRRSLPADIAYQNATFVARRLG
ncbi:class I SAM-dependent methyltransferase [Reyranella sp.]|uniref:class I SAM-dependent methyltransferase n=1 Tax=Reyranella sp. TaxID=1929291 RepID=UPI003D149ADD